MGRAPRSLRYMRQASSPLPRRRGRPPKSRRPTSPLDNPGFTVNCVTTPDDRCQTFHLSNGAIYTILPVQSSPEHHWGTIHAAEWNHPESKNGCLCVIKATEFLLRRRIKGEGIEYRRPRNDFEREIRAFQMTRHRNILRMYDFWEWEGRGYISMKLMKGSLGDVVYDPAYVQILDGLRHDEAAIAELVRQILCGLQHLHVHKMIYRDVKPDNLLISTHPRIKLADFGNVHFMSSDDEMIKGMEGTPSYMSPEMRRGHYYDRKTDIWSLGITLLNVLFDDNTTFPNFEFGGTNAAKRFAEEQEYLSEAMCDFTLSLFAKADLRPTACELLRHPFLLKADKSAFKQLFSQLPTKNLTSVPESQENQPQTPPPTPYQRSSSTVARLESPKSTSPERLTPPVSPTASSLFEDMITVTEQPILDCIQVQISNDISQSTVP